VMEEGEVNETGSCWQGVKRRKCHIYVPSSKKYKPNLFLFKKIVSKRMKWLAISWLSNHRYPSPLNFRTRISQISLATVNVLPYSAWTIQPSIKLDSVHTQMSPLASLKRWTRTIHQLMSKLRSKCK
jgi:hypothetical protein